jgi:hypothetical protein
MTQTTVHPRTRDRSFVAAWILLSTLFLFLSYQAYRLPLEAYIRDLNIDDSFYYLVIARNLAAGIGSTFDGVNATNGFHPLWAYSLAGLHKLGTDPVTMLRVTKLCEVLLLGGASLLFLLTGRLLRIPPIVLLIPPLFWIGMDPLYEGMEGGLQFFLLNAALYAFVRVHGSPDRILSWATLSALSGLLVWARVEAGILGILPLLAILSLRQRTRVSRRILLVLAAMPFASLGFYFIYNWSLFGALSPISGAVKRFNSRLLWQGEGGYNLVGNAAAMLSIAKMWQGLAVGAIGLGWMTKVRREGRALADYPLLIFLLALAVNHLALYVYMTLFVHRSYAEYGHYYITLFLMTGIVLVIVLTELRSALRRWMPTALAQGGFWGVLTLLALTLLVAFVRQVPEWYRPEKMDWELISYKSSNWLDQNLPDGAVVGINSAGVFGYFANARIVNLDGLVNSQDYFQALRSGWIAPWLVQEGVTHLAGMLPEDAPEESPLPIGPGWNPHPTRGRWRKMYVDPRRIDTAGSRQRFTVYRYDASSP